MKKLIAIIFFVCVVINLNGSNVPRHEAEKIAKKFYYNLLKSKNIRADIKQTEDVIIANLFEDKKGEEVVFYIINFINPEGFVIISAEDLALPILGYSTESNFDINKDMHPGLLGLLENYRQQIVSIRKGNYNNDELIRKHWDKLRSEKENYEIKAIVEPLIETLWNQDKYYNAMCPADPSGPDGHVYAGCVAVTMGQVMKYWNYPNQGNGSSSYYAGSYGLLSANYGQTIYDWTAMPKSLTTYNDEVARLLFHCGVSVQMNYGPNGSGSQISYAASALKNYFRYSTASFAQKINYTTSNWHNLLKTDLNNKKPLIYAGFTSDTPPAGHAFNFDGYDENSGVTYYHINWGWSGMYDGYFTIDNLNSGNGDFTNGQQVVYNIYPGNDYPYNCGPTKTLTALRGTFEDGSGIFNYQNNLNCSWLIAPNDTIVKITITVDKIDTEEGVDTISIYDGSNSSAPLIATISGSTPPTNQFSTTGPRAFITFKTNGSVTKEGWRMSWISQEAILCSGVVTYTTPTGTLNDGSGQWQYNNNSNCKWKIQPPNAATVTLTFTEFDLEQNDRVRVYDKSGTGATLLGTFTGNTIPAPVTSDKGEMYIFFQSNDALTAQGFTAHWTSTYAGIDEIDLNNLKLFPNPANNYLFIATGISIKNALKVNILNTLGQSVKTLSFTDINNGLLNVDISDIPEGVYFVNLSDNINNITKKIVITKK